MENRTRKIVFSALLAALTCVATMIIKIPSPLKGYLNLGDCTVLLSGWLLGSSYGFLAAGVGSALADIFSGYVVYAPATFLIKGLMALAVYLLYNALSKKAKPLPSRIISGVVSEIIMVFGYYVFEGFLYGFVPALVNIPANAIQGAVGLAVGTILVNIFEKNHIQL